MAKMNHILYTILLLVAPISVTGQSLKTPVDGVIATGMQIAQVRFMLEVYATIGAGIKYHAPKEELKKAIASYEETLSLLEKKIADPTVQSAVKTSRTAWVPVKKALLTALEKRDIPAMKKSALFVHDHIRAVIRQMEIMNRYFSKNLKRPHPAAIGAAIEMAVSARRLSSHYMLKMWEVPDPTIEAHWNQGMQKYRQALAALQQSDVAHDPMIAAELKVCAKEYGFFETVIGFDTYMPVLVKRHAEAAYASAGKIALKLLGR